MRFAIPMYQGKLCMHFGHCEQFAVVETDETGAITGREDLTPPAHEPGVLPAWLGGLGVNVIIAGGMGQRAQQLFAQKQVKVVVGAPSETPEVIVKAYLDNTLETGDNVCDH